MPQNVIRFAEGFERFFRATEPRWQELEAAVNDAFAAYEKRGFAQALQHEWHAALNALEIARVAVWARWRTALELGAFVPCIRDPDHGLILELNKGGWGGPPGLGPRCSLDDFICPDDPIQPGPLAAIGGKLRPVFFMKDDFEKALAAMSGRSTGGRRGPKPRYDRGLVRQIVFQQMDHHGDFSQDDPEWRAQADLERTVQKEFESRGYDPADSTVRELIAEPLAEWRALKARR
jgi:hypothetical protein